MENLTSVRRIDIVHNPLLVNLQGLNNLTTVSGPAGIIAIGGNVSLQTLSGLENLSQGGEYIAINDNPVLTDFCPLKKVFTSFNRSYSCYGNATNPTQGEILANCP